MLINAFFHQWLHKCICYLKLSLKKNIFKHIKLILNTNADTGIPKQWFSRSHDTWTVLVDFSKCINLGLYLGRVLWGCNQEINFEVVFNTLNSQLFIIFLYMCVYLQCIKCISHQAVTITVVLHFYFMCTRLFHVYAFLQLKDTWMFFPQERGSTTVSNYFFMICCNLNGSKLVLEWHKDTLFFPITNYIF